MHGRGRRFQQGPAPNNSNNYSDDVSVSSQVSNRSQLSLNTSYSVSSSNTNPNIAAHTNSTANISTDTVTTSARWGWVKASLIHNESHHHRRVSSSNSSVSSPDVKHGNSSTPWQRHNLSKTTSIGSISTTSSTNPATTSLSSPIDKGKPPSPERISSPSSVTLEIIDLESEYHGKVVNVPLDALPDSNNSHNNNKNSHRKQLQQHNDNQPNNTFNVSNGSVYGDGIVMANAWPNFTSIPTKKTSTKKQEQPQHSSSSSARNGFSYRHKFDHNNDNNDDDNETSDDSDDSNAIPSDLTNLTHLHEPAVVYCLRNRYVMDEIYTSTGPILLALNPFKDVRGTYGEDLMRKYWEKGEGLLDALGIMPSSGTNNSSNNRNTGTSRRGKTAKSGDGEKLTPHVYAVADNAFRNMIRMMDDRSATNELMSDQSILVSGESGAGKTVTTKIIMKYLAALSKRSCGCTSPKVKTVLERTRAVSTTAGREWGKGNVGRGMHSPPAKTNTTPSVSSPTRKSTNIEQQVLESNPILESFGNARTIRNDNSSRFGKFIEIQFTSRGKLVGASVDSYLLEKVRLINQSDGERNYHIFYELLAGANGSERKSLMLGTKGPQDFRMTNSESETYKRRDGVRDDSTFAALKKAMVTMGFNPEEQLDILGIVSSLLHLSNITFQERGSNGCTLDDSNASLGAALHLLRVDKTALDAALCSVNIEAGMERVVKKLGLSQSMKAKEALIKATYGALFAYLVKRINSCINGQRRREHENSDENEENSGEGKIENLEGEGSNSSIEQQLKSDAFIGVLDIFGFESFEENSFEQLCINYCNESLQQQFNKFVFKLEQAEYEKEGISWNFIAFPDNQNVLDLIHKKRTGVLSILDEQSFLGQCTDQSFAQSVYQKCTSSRSSQNINPLSASTQQMANGTFSIKHYAGPVEYTATGFLEKNKDELPKEALELLISSENSLLHHLANIMNTDPSSGDDGPSNKRTGKGYGQNSLKRMSVGMQFSSQLSLLRNRIDATSPHYIRCLKPNDELQPDNFDTAVIAEQLRCAGILEAVRVSRVGYPQRYSHERFVLRYQALAMQELDLRRKDASTSFTSPVGFGGFHGVFVPKSQRLAAEKAAEKKKKMNRPPSAEQQPKLTAEQECKILVSVLAKQLAEAQQEAKSGSLSSSSSEEENIAPSDAGWSEVKKREGWPQVSSSSKFKTPIRSKKKKELNLIDIGLQMGQTKVFLRQHAFEALEQMRGRIKIVAANVISSIIRMFLARRRYIIMRNEYRTRLAQRSRMIEEANGHIVETQYPNDPADFYFQQEESALPMYPPDSDGAKLHFQNMHISLHREPDYEGAKEFKWVWVDNRWVKNMSDESSSQLS